MARRLTSTREGRLYGAALVVGLLVAGAILVAFARRLYFFGDDWDYLLNRGTSAIGLFAPHNEHWSTLPILLFRGLFATFGLDHYLPYALPVIVTHLVLSALVYLVLVRLGCSRAPALAAAGSTASTSSPSSARRRHQIFRGCCAASRRLRVMASLR